MLRIRDLLWYESRTSLEGLRVDEGHDWGLGWMLMFVFAEVVTS